MKINNSFKTDRYQYNSSFGMQYPITRTKGVSPDFVEKVEKCLESLPDEWQHTLLRNNYEMYCSNSIQDAFDYNLVHEKAPDWEAITCTHPFQPFFVFTPKIEKEYLQKVINHEISHGIVHSEGLAENPEYVKEICKDAEAFEKGKPDYKKPHDIKQFLLQPIDNYRVNEIFADIIAWAQKGGGLWGSGYKNGDMNPNFFKENFPNTFEKLKQFKPYQGEEKIYFDDFYGLDELDDFDELDEPF